MTPDLKFLTYLILAPISFFGLIATVYHIMQLWYEYTLLELEQVLVRLLSLELYIYINTRRMHVRPIDLTILSIPIT